MKTKIFLALFFAGLLYLWFVDNIAIQVGDENHCFSRQEVFEANNPGINEFGDPELKKPTDASVDMSDFLQFISALGSQPLFRHEVSYLDTTGDGKLEKVNSVVSVDNGVCSVHNYIEKDGRRIFDDHFEINKEHLTLAMGDEVQTENFGPYALFYLGLLKSRFVELVHQSTNTAPFIFELKNNALMLSYFEDNASSEAYLLNYKGAFLFSQNPGNKTIYMWNTQLETFVPVREWQAEILPA